MEERRIRFGSVIEWGVAGLGVVALMYGIAVPVQRVLGPHVEAALVEAPNTLPPGVPAGATSIPVMLLLDGREIRQGELHTRLESLLPETQAEGPAHISIGQFGERHTRGYIVDGTRFYVVCERLEPGGAMRVAGIYLP